MKHAQATIRMLQSGPIIESAEEWRRKQARIAWVQETTAALAEAQEAMNERCCAAVDKLSEEDFDRLVDEEQAKVDVFLAPLHAAAKHGKWPKHLHWGGI
jgi:hypothetical protein